MTAISDAVLSIPAEDMPATSSTQLLASYIERYEAAGHPREAAARVLGIGKNNLSMYKTGTQRLSLPRVLPLAEVLGLSDSEREELLHAVIMEVHGRKGVVDAHALAAWADSIKPATSDQRALLEIWDEACAPAPHLIAGLLRNEGTRVRVLEYFQAVVDYELKSLMPD